MAYLCFLFWFECVFCDVSFFFFFNDPATTEISTLSLHDALPISRPPAPRGAGCIPALGSRETAAATATSCRRWRSRGCPRRQGSAGSAPRRAATPGRTGAARARSEEHTSELQSRLHLVCRLLLEK